MSCTLLFCEHVEEYRDAEEPVPVAPMIDWDLRGLPAIENALWVVLVVISQRTPGRPLQHIPFVHVCRRANYAAYLSEHIATYGPVAFCNGHGCASAIEAVRLRRELEQLWGVAAVLADS